MVEYHAPPGTGERYAAATQTSNLRCNAESRGDVDMLIAAGWIAEGLGTSLYSLQIEFDAVAQDLKRLPSNASQTDRALIAAESALKERERDARDEEIERLKSKVGEITMANELLYSKIGKLEAGRPLVGRRSRK